MPAAPPQAAPAFVATPLGDRWAELVGRLVQAGSVAALVRELAAQAGLERIDGGTQPPTWHLLVERDSLRTDALRDKLCQALSAELGQPLQLVLQPRCRRIRRRGAMPPSASAASARPKRRSATTRWSSS